MKKVDVDVVERVVYHYSWQCPHCRRPIELPNERDRALQILVCPGCTTQIFRQEPGVYGTERPQ